MDLPEMKSAELRATIAAQILSGLLATDDPFLDGTDDALTDHAVILADLLLAKLDPSASSGSGLTGRTTPAPTSGTAPKWQCSAICSPSAHQKCRVIHWDEEFSRIEYMTRAYWDGSWLNGDYRLIDDLVGVQDSSLYWTPFENFASLGEASADFLQFMNK